MNKEKWKILILSSLGGGLEYYDFIIYAIFAPYIGKAFFPSENPVVSLIETFMVFGLGYLARPIGGFIFGHMGDKFGRKRIFTITIFIMAISSFLISIVPGYYGTVKVFLIFLLALSLTAIFLQYIKKINPHIQFLSTILLIALASVIIALMPSQAEIGLTATIVFCILRIVQGISLGGEIPGSITFICEHLKENRGFACGTLYFFVNNGIVVATLVQWLIFITLPNEAAVKYGWRIAFFFGGILAIISYYIRVFIEETPDFIKSSKNLQKIPLVTLFKKHYWGLISGFLIASFGATIVAIPYLYISSYMITVLHYSEVTTNSITLIGTMLYSFFILTSGFLTDFIGARNATIIGIIALIFFPVSFFIILSIKPDYTTLLILFSLMAFFSGLPTASFPVILAELFPTEVRYSGIATCYNIAYAIFCGLVPLACSALIHFTNNTHCPAYIFVFSALLGLIGIIIITTKKQLTIKFK